jgi:hypothetical protein
MPGKRETSPNGSSVLKTTTWGSVIAMSAAILVAGLVGLNPSPRRTNGGKGDAAGWEFRDACSRRIL